MSKKAIFSMCLLSTLLATPLLFSDSAPPVDPSITSTLTSSSHANAFTGKVIGSHVRMRIAPDLDSHIVQELNKNEYILITGKKGDFYSIQAPNSLKAYVFRGFVIDGHIEGDRVNVRLSPDREAPIIGHYNSGEPIQGTISHTNNKWLEILPPSNTQFFVSKEFIEYAGDIQFKASQDKRKLSVSNLLESTHLLKQAEMHKSFNEIDIQRITHDYQTIITDYSDFDTYAQKAKKALAETQDQYLHKKIEFLETKAALLDNQSSTSDQKSLIHTSNLSMQSRSKSWEPIEQSLFISWSSMHHSKTMTDFYEEQKLTGKLLSGVIESYSDPIMQKPGDFILKDEKNLTIAYLYSTHLDLNNYIGKHIDFTVSSRPNNHFAFPAYYVIEENN